MAVSGNSAFSLDTNSGIDIWNFSDPVNLALLGNIPEYPLGSLAIQGTILYAHNWNEQALKVYDVSDPTNPALLSAYKLLEGTAIVTRPNAITVNGNYLYALEHTFPEDVFTEVIDISDPEHPEHVANLPDFSFLYNQLIFQDNSLYAVRDDGLGIYDASDPLAPAPLGLFPGYGGIAAQPQAGRAAYLDLIGFQTVDTSDPSNPDRLGITAWPRYSGDIAVSGNTLILVPGPIYGALLQAVDITLLGDPQVADSLMVDTYISPYGDISIEGSSLAVPTVDGVAVVDFSNPYDLQAGSLELGDLPNGETRAVDIQSGRAYAITQEYDHPMVTQNLLSIIDVTDPLNPVLLGELNLGENAGDFVDLSVAQQGAATVAYVTSTVNWLAVDVSDPAAPVILFREEITPPSSSRLIETATQGEQTTAYLAQYGDPGSLVAVDVSDPANPVTLGIFPLEIEDPYGRGHVLMVEGSMVYFANRNESELILVDFSQPEQPVWVGTATLPDAAITGASLTQDYVTVLSREVGEYVSDSFGNEVYIFDKRIHLEGRVIDHNGIPIEGVTLALSNGETLLTGQDGLYAFTDLVLGSYAVTPTLGEYVFTPPFAVLEGFISGWQNFVMLAPPVSTALEPGITTTLTYTDVQGLPTSFVFPAGLVSATATATVTPTLASPFFGMDFAGHAFDLSVRETGSPTEMLTFTLPVSVTIQYSPMDVAAIIDSMPLALYRRDGDAWVKIETACLENPVPVPVEPWVFRATLCQSGRYALFGPTHGIALPYVSFGSHTGGSPPPPPVNEVSLSRQ